MARKVIARQSLPAKFPFSFTGVVCLLLDRFNVPSWAWGVAITILVIYWIIIIVSILTEEEIKVIKP